MLSYFSGIRRGHRDCDDSDLWPYLQVILILYSRWYHPELIVLGCQEAANPENLRDALKRISPLIKVEDRGMWKIRIPHDTSYFEYQWAHLSHNNHLVLGRFWPSKWLPKWDCRYTHLMLFVLFIWSYSGITAHHFLCFEIFSGIMMYIMPFCLVCAWCSWAKFELNPIVRNPIVSRLKPSRWMLGAQHY